MERRSYNEYCGLAKGLDVIGERWTLLIVRNLLLGPLRYSDLLRGLPGITTNLLAKRLREMDAAGIVEKVRESSADPGGAYRLTALGLALEPVVHAIGHWAWQWMPAPSRGELRNIEWLLVALRRRYRGHTPLRVELLVDDVPYRMILGEDSVEIARGAVPGADLRIQGTGASVTRFFLEKPVRGELPEGIVADGSAAALRTLRAAFVTSERESL